MSLQESSFSRPRKLAAPRPGDTAPSQAPMSSSAISAPLRAPRMQGMVRSLGPARRPRGAQGTGRPPRALNRGSPAPPPAELSGCSPALAPSCGSLVPRGPSERRARGSQFSPSEKTPRNLRLPSADAQGGPTWRLYPPSPRGGSELDLERALFGLLEDQREAEKPWGQDPSKDRVTEILDRARVLGRGARPPRTKDGRNSGSTDAAPNELGASGANKLSCSGGGGWGAGLEACPPSLCAPPPASIPPPPSLRPPVSSPPPRASVHLDSSLSSPLLLLPLAFLPHFPPVVSPVSSFVFSPPSPPGASLLLRAAGEEVGALRPGPARRGGRCFSYFSRVIWRDCTCARA